MADLNALDLRARIRRASSWPTYVRIHHVLSLARRPRFTNLMKAVPLMEKAGTDVLGLNGREKALTASRSQNARHDQVTKANPTVNFNNI